jgi:hypothetical protein
MTLSRSNTVIAVTALLGGAAAINNGLAITPPMGWVRLPKQAIEPYANGKRTTGTPLDATYLKSCSSQHQNRS